MDLKVKADHQQKPAYIYIRQSTMGQVRFHQESTERQYNLKNKVLQLGWPLDLIKILDGDLGISGAQSTGREDFKLLVADVTMGQVGAVVALEASRLARSNADWHRLIEICALTRTLIIDEDGCYDPSEFNDGLLLGLKATMSQAELHFIRARLQGGKLNKARKGELRFPLPVGLCCDERGQIVPDPDVQVQGAVRLVFETFKETGSAYAVAHHFAKQGLQFPKRSYGGVWAGKLIWGRLTHARVLGVLKNPSYAGVYAFGRYRSTKTITPDGEIRQAIKKAPIGSWLVDIKNHHEGYISWDEFLHNQQLLEANRTNGEETLLSGPAREGLTLLQGLLLCSVCGKRVSVRYKGNGGIYPMYECNGHRRDGVSTTSCLSVRADLLDKAISKRVLEILQPSQFQIAVAALEELEHRDEATTKQWQMRIEQAEYEAQLAERRYSEVDPSNRLVAGTLERRWNDALLKLDELKQQLERFRQEHCRVLTTEQKDRALALAQDLPRLWAAPSTQAKDRKRMLRLLLKEVTVEKQRLQSQIVLHVRWQGGAVEDIRIDLIPPVYDQFRYSDEVVEKVRELAQHLNDEQIANALNQEGVRPSKGQRFTANAIRWIRYRRRIKGPQLKQAEELTVQDVAEMFGVGLHIVYDWIDNGTVQARKVNNGSPWWITIGKGKETELFDWVANSGKIRKPRQALTSAEGSAL